MRTKLAALVLTAGLATGGAALVAPSASAADSATSTATTSPSADTSAAARVAARLSSIEGALTSLVTDGTITQAQADRVASTLSTSDALRRGGHGRHGGAGHLGPDAVAKVLGIPTDQLRTQEQAGKTLTQIAATKGISKTDLVTELVAAAKAQLAADVSSGRTTQAAADAKAATLTADLTQRVDRVHQAHGDSDGDAVPSPSA